MIKINYVFLIWGVYGDIIKNYGFHCSYVDFFVVC